MRFANVIAALVIALIAMASTDRVNAAPVALNDDELAKVSGQDGVSLGVHLELNSALLSGTPTDSRITAGFNVDGTKTYAVIQNLAGVMDLIAVTLAIRQRPDGGGDYVDIGLPGFVGFKQFGFRALAAQTDPTAPIAPAASYGQILLNGTGSMTGHIYLWAQ
jgi:hypothetical protein